MYHMSLQVSIGEICLSGEDAATGGRRGAFPTGEARFCGFPLAPWGGCEGFIIRGALLPADLYLLSFLSLAACTEILHCVQNDASDRKILLSTVEVLHRTAKSAEVGL